MRALALFLACLRPASAAAVEAKPIAVVLVPAPPRESKRHAPILMPEGSGLRLEVKDKSERLLLNGAPVLEPRLVGCFNVSEVRPTPDKKHFIVLLACPEGDDTLYVLGAAGEKTAITAQWDSVNARSFDLSPDGRRVIYDRVNSCCADKPDGAVWPPQGIVLYDVATARKRLLAGGSVDAAVPPRWSPDGRRLAFMRLNKAATESDACVMDSNGGGVRILSHLKGRASALTWAGTPARPALRVGVAPK